jgi:hypothetical protein
MSQTGGRLTVSPDRLSAGEEVVKTQPFWS